MAVETVVVLDPIAPATAARMRALLPPGLVLTHGTAREEAHLEAIIAEADYAISGQIAVPGRVLRAGRKLRLLHKWGVGVDNLDLETARTLGIPVARTTGSNSVPVAEHALGLMLAAMRHIAEGHARMGRGEWGAGGRPSAQLSGKVVGIIGWGATGQALARLLGGFDCTVIPAGRDAAARDAVLAASDVVSLHCPLTAENAGMIDRAALLRMKRGAVLVNVARGGLVVEADLIWALREGLLAAAAMDVFETEPLPATSPLVGVPGLVLTPHIAAQAAETFEPTVRQMFDNIGRVSRGEALPARDVVA